MFGIDDMAMATGFSALANLGGGLISSAGQASANAENVRMQNQLNQQMLNAQMAQHAQNTGFMEDQQAFNREERQFAETFNASEAEKGRIFSAQQADKFFNLNTEFQKYMSDTQFQRRMADLKAAGLNPILAYQQGGAVGGSSAGGAGAAPTASIAGASSGMASSSALPNLTSPRVQNEREAIGRAIGNAANSAVETYKTIQGVDLMKEQESLTRQKERESKASEDNIKQDTMRKVEETRRTAGEADNTKAAGDLMRANATSAGARAAVDAEAARVYGKYDSPQAPTLMERIGRIVQGAIESGTMPPAVNRVLPSAPSAPGGSDFWGTSDKIRQRAEENRRKYGN